MTVKEQLESFYRFANEQLEADDCDKSLDELFQEWRAAYRTSAEYRENVAAIQVALDGLRNGDKGRPAEEVIAELRERLENSEARRDFAG